MCATTRDGHALQAFHPAVRRAIGRAGDCNRTIDAAGLGACAVKAE